MTKKYLLTEDDVTPTLDNTTNVIESQAVKSVMDTKLTKVTDATIDTQVYAKDDSGNQIMLDTSDEVKNNVVVTRTPTGHVKVPITPETDSSATSKQYVDTHLETKVDKETGKGLSSNDFTDEYLNKLSSVEEHAERNVQSDWEVDDSSSDAFIINKPFKKVGNGLKVVDGILTVSGVGLQIKVVDRLPTIGDPNTIYLVPNTKGTHPDVYDEYIYTNGNWECIGNTKFTLTIDQDASDIIINNIPLQKANRNTTGLITSHDWNVFDNKQDALTFDNSPRSGSSNPVKSSGIKIALDGKANVSDLTGIETRITVLEEDIMNIEPGAQKNVQADWNEGDINSDAYIRNKPSHMPIESHAMTHVNGTDDIQLANSTRKGLLSKEDWITFNNKQDALTFDDLPTYSSVNPVKSNGIKLELDKKVDVEQGVSKAGYFLRVNQYGIVDAQNYDPSAVEFVNIGGSPYDNTNLSYALNSKVDKVTKVGSSALSSDVTPTALANDTKEITVTFKNKTVDADDNVILDLETDNFKAGVVVTEFKAVPSHLSIPTERLVKESLDAKLDDEQLVSAWSNVPTNNEIPSAKLVKDNLDTKQKKVLYGTSDPTPEMGEVGDIYIKIGE